jgi:hypothetical protein
LVLAADVEQVLCQMRALPAQRNEGSSKICPRVSIS